jgi:hypothetical protein
MKDINENELNEYKIKNLSADFIEQYEDCYNVGDIIIATLHKLSNDRYSVVIYDNVKQFGVDYRPFTEVIIANGDVEFVKNIKTFNENDEEYISDDN